MSTPRWHRPAVRITVGGLLIVAVIWHLAPARPTGPIGSTQDQAQPISRLIGANVAGNQRPSVLGYGGLMIGRCQAVALYAAAGVEAGSLRRELHSAAAAHGIGLIDLSADVLSPATLQRQVPEVVACLAASSGAAAANRLLASPLPGVNHHASESVLIHQLAFSVRPVGIAVNAVAAAVNREGILSDTLGTYQIVPSRSAESLSISYTGALLGDAEVEVVREAIARQSRTATTAVTVTALSTTGPAIDLATEPAPAPETELPSTPHHR